MNRISDLEDLIGFCRSEDGRRYFTEAVQCYQVGAYRACITTVWLAVVFDFVSKLRDLEALGVPIARDKLIDLEKWRKAKDIKNLLAFEESIPDVAEKDYSFISLIDKITLQRIKEDRNQCAHPSSGPDYAPYDPSAETARCHLKNAVDVLLRHPAALSTPGFERICDAIEADSFPTEVEPAKAFLSSRLLIRPTDRLIKKLVSGLAAVLLKEDRTQAFRFRAFAALGAIRDLHPLESSLAFEATIRSKIHEVSDADFDRVYSLCRYRQETWDVLTAESKIKCEQLLRVFNGVSQQKVLTDAAMIPALAEISNQIQHELDVEELQRMLNPTEEPIDAAKIAEIVSNYVLSSSFAGASSNARALVRIADRLSDLQLRSVLIAYRTNDQIWYSWEVHGEMHKFLSATLVKANSVRDEWYAIYNGLILRKNDAVAMITCDRLVSIFPEFLVDQVDDNDLFV